MHFEGLSTKHATQFNVNESYNQRQHFPFKSVEAIEVVITVQLEKCAQRMSAGFRERHT
jgi:hypothetical protein